MLSAVWLGSSYPDAYKDEGRPSGRCKNHHKQGLAQRRTAVGTSRTAKTRLREGDAATDPEVVNKINPKWVGEGSEFPAVSLNNQGPQLLALQPDVGLTMEEGKYN